MKVYILVGFVDYEGSEVVSVHLTEGGAERTKKKIIAAIKADDNHEFSHIDAFKVQEHEVKE